MNSSNNRENQSLIGAQFKHVIAVTIAYWVIKFLGLHVWAWLGKAGAIYLGIVTIFMVFNNISIVLNILENRLAIKLEGSSSAVFIIPMFFKFGVDCLAAFLVYKLFVLFF